MKVETGFLGLFNTVLEVSAGAKGTRIGKEGPKLYLQLI